MGGEQDFDPVAGANVEDLGGPQQRAQCRKARRNLRPRHRKTGDFVHAGMPVGQTYDTDLVHRTSLTAAARHECHRMVTGTVCPY